MCRSLPRLGLASGWLATWSEHLTPLEDMSSNPLCGHEPITVITWKTYGVQFSILVTIDVIMSCMTCSTLSFWLQLRTKRKQLGMSHGRLTCPPPQQTILYFSIPKCRHKALLEGAM
jgi:hypothetical protein